jgi:hypothetical protein
MGSETIYWGVLCRACSEPIAFGAPSHRQFELESVYARPGSISCGQGHSFYYFPRDFKFFESAKAITEAVMRLHRETHVAINPIAAVPITAAAAVFLSGTRWVPDKELEARSQQAPQGAKAQTVSAGPDLLSAKAQTVARERWAARSIKKAM